MFEIETSKPHLARRIFFIPRLNELRHEMSGADVISQFETDLNTDGFSTDSNGWRDVHRVWAQNAYLCAIQYGLYSSLVEPPLKLVINWVALTYWKRASCITKQARAEDILAQVNKKECNWAGHLRLSRNKRSISRVTEWKPCDDTITSKRPLTRLTKEITKFRCMECIRTVQCRSCWKSVIHLPSETLW